MGEYPRQAETGGKAEGGQLQSWEEEERARKGSKEQKKKKKEKRKGEKDGAAQAECRPQNAEVHFPSAWKGTSSVPGQGSLHDPLAVIPNKVGAAEG